MTEQHRERLEAILRELWAAKSLDLHMCDGTTKQDQFGLLRDLREDVRAVLSALAPQAGDNAEEPVAWRWRSEIFTEWNVSDRDPISQENMERETEMNMRGLEIQPLYTHPCPSTPVVSQNAPDLQDKGGETVTLLARVAAIICEETCGLTSACKSREAARSLLDKGYLSAEPKIAANVAIRKAGDAAVDKLVDRFALTHFMPDSDDLADHLRSIVDACVRAATEKPE